MLSEALQGRPKGLIEEVKKDMVACDLVEILGGRLNGVMDVCLMTSSYLLLLIFPQ